MHNYACFKILEMTNQKNCFFIISNRVIKLNTLLYKSSLKTNKTFRIKFKPVPFKFSRLVSIIYLAVKLYEIERYITLYSVKIQI